MLLSEVDYHLRPESIAQEPAEPRDSARLLVDRGVGRPDDWTVRDLTRCLKPGDLLVVNDTRVIPARLVGTRNTGGAAEVLLLEPIDASRCVWEALVRPGRKLKPGSVVRVGELDIVVGEVLGDDGRRRVTLHTDDPDAALAAYGEMPLPPYITQSTAAPDRYQTVYAKRPASAAAPTAGLHLTDVLLDQVRDGGVGIERVELVVGLDTFRPVVVDDTDDHLMHSEAYTVPASTLAAIQATHDSGGRVVAVGTTTTRALESAAALGQLSGRTSLFIQRPYPWAVVDLMMTNFHVPKSTLLVMIDAFIGPRWRDLYTHAQSTGYRFLSFGDTMLLDRSA